MGSFNRPIHRRAGIDQRAECLGAARVAPLRQVDDLDDILMDDMLTRQRFPLDHPQVGAVLPDFLDGQVGTQQGEQVGA